MSLRLRLILVFFLLSVVPLGAVTFFTYWSNAAALREAAGREAELLTGDLTDRMRLVTVQLGQQFAQIMSSSEVGEAASTALEPGTASQSVVEEASAAEARRVAAQLGEMAMLLNNVEVRGFGRRRFRNGPRPPTPDAAPDAARPGNGNGPPGSVAPPRRDGPPAAEGSTDAPSIEIDLSPVRRAILEQFAPDRETFDQLSPEQRRRILTAVNERMLGIRQGIEILQQKAAERVADAQAQMAEPPAAPAAPSAPAPPPPDRPVPAVAGPLQRTTELSGRRLDIRLSQDGEVVGQVNAEINLPNLLATVFTATRGERGEVPFAIDEDGRVYTQNDADRQQLLSIGLVTPDGLAAPLVGPDVPPGTTLLGNWVVVTTPDPTGSELEFGIARPVGEALNDLRRTAARNAGMGLAFIGLALIGMVPLASRLTRNLTKLSEGVNRIAQGDYRARVEMRSADEVGRLAQAFNQMAADVERHQQAAVEQERLRRELELGRQIQNDMLPQAPLRLGLTEIQGVSVPALEVGGDFFNYFQTGSGQIALLMGDVAGKGVGAALLMANLQASLRTRLALGQDLAALAAALDRDIESNTAGLVYATLFVGLLDPVTRTLDYVNAGHNPQYVLRRAGGLERMESTGLPVGLIAGRGYAQRRMQLEAGDVLFFYTDGCVDAENTAGENFGAARLEALLVAESASASGELLARIESAIASFSAGREPSDDATMMVVSVG